MKYLKGFKAFTLSCVVFLTGALFTGCLDGNTGSTGAGGGFSGLLGTGGLLSSLPIDVTRLTQEADQLQGILMALNAAGHVSTNDASRISTEYLQFREILAIVGPLLSRNDPAPPALQEAATKLRTSVTAAKAKATPLVPPVK